MDENTGGVVATKNQALNSPLRPDTRLVEKVFSTHRDICGECSFAEPDDWHAGDVDGHVDPDELSAHRCRDREVGVNSCHRRSG